MFEIAQELKQVPIRVISHYISAICSFHRYHHTETEYLNDTDPMIDCRCTNQGQARICQTYHRFLT